MPVVPRLHRVFIDHKKLEEILDFFEDRKVTVEVANRKNYHLIVTGTERVVNFYPTTGTISCNPCKKHKKAFNLKDTKHETALNRVVDIANIGY